MKEGRRVADDERTGIYRLGLKAKDATSMVFPGITFQRTATLGVFPQLLFSLI